MRILKLGPKRETMRSLTRPKVLKLSQHIADAIKKRILVGEFAVGSTLSPISQLAAELGIGQSTLREALRILEDDGFIVLKIGPGGGPVVSHPGDEKVSEIVANILQLKKTKLRDLHESRYYLDVPIARIATRTRTDEDLARLAASIKASREATDNDEFLRHTVSFHQILADCAQNRILRLFFGCVRDLLVASFSRVEFDAKWRAAECDEHERIYEAIRDRREEAAEYWMRKHLEGFESVLSELFEQSLEKLI